MGVSAQTNSNLGGGTLTGVSAVDNTLYVDGTKYTTLASALSALSAGQTLVIPQNVTLGSTTTTSLNNITIQCVNNATISPAANVQWYFTGNFQSIQDCNFTGPGIGTNTAQTIIASGSNFKFLRNTVSGFGPTGNGHVEIIGGGVIEVSDNTMYGNAEGPLFVNNQATGTLIDRLRVERNHVDSSAATVSGTENIAIHSTTGTANLGEIIVSGNVLRGPKSYCLEIGNFGGGVPYDVIVSGNSCRLTQTSSSGGYSIVGDVRATITGNVFDSNGYGYGIAGLELGGNISGSTDFAVLGNVINGGAPASSVSGIGCNVLCQHIVISGNTVNGFGTSAAGTGISLETSTVSGQITDNVVESNTIIFPASGAGKGIWQQCNAASTVCSRNTYTGNNIYGTGTSGSEGLSLENDTGTSDRNNIGPNTITNVDTGIFLSSGVTHVLLATQQISSFTTAAISDSSTGEVYPTTVNLTSGGSTGTSSISPTLGSSSNYVFTLPPAGGTLSLLGITSCGSSAACSPASQIVGKGWIMNGTVAFSSSTTASITGLAPAFTAATSFNCSAADPTHAYTWLITAQTTSGFTITAGTSNSDTWNWTCVGY
jgi:hypothetical protein